MTLSIIIATAFREETLPTALDYLRNQERQPDEVIVVDGAPKPGVEALVTEKAGEVDYPVRYFRAEKPSAAGQRNLGVAKSTGDLIMFMDDDAYPDSDCLAKITEVFEADSAGKIGGVGALLSNQHASPPSPRAKKWFDFLADEKRDCYAGCVIGPAINILPYATEDARVVDVEWLNSTCTAYRREVFLAEGFGSHFTGYSFMEDVDLSVRIARNWKLKVHTGAQAFHDSRHSQFKQPFNKAKMGVVNRYYVMTHSLGKKALRYRVKFLISQLMSMVLTIASIRSSIGLVSALQSVAGSCRGMISLFTSLLRP